MRLDELRCREHLAAARHAHLATADRDGMPHVVPVTFAVDRNEIVIGTDHKPKSTLNLKRLRNLRENPNATVLVDHYADDWRQLWWVRVDGAATIVEDFNDPAHQRAVALLTARYDQYRSLPPKGPMIHIRARHWTGWAYEF